MITKNWLIAVGIGLLFFYAIYKILNRADEMQKGDIFSDILSKKEYKVKGRWEK